MDNNNFYTGSKICRNNFFDKILSKVKEISEEEPKGDLSYLAKKKRKKIIISKIDK